MAGDSRSITSGTRPPGELRSGRHSENLLEPHRQPRRIGFVVYPDGGTARHRDPFRRERFQLNQFPVSDKIAEGVREGLSAERFQTGMPFREKRRQPILPGSRRVSLPKGRAIPLPELYAEKRFVSSAIFRGRTRAGGFSGFLREKLSGVPPRGRSGVWAGRFF